jgi:nitrite reductase (NADH) small subunit/3-phenylpropionate/trans-cinnamate dioxygenase ferredoxin subunit
MNKYISVASVSEIPPGTGRTVEVEGVWIAVFNLSGTFYAIDNACPHAGGPLGEGKLCGTDVECPWHGWKFNIISGERVGNPNFQVARCDVQVMDGQIKISLPAELRFPPSN